MDESLPIEESPLDRICTENADLYVYAMEGKLDAAIAKLAAEAGIEIEHVQEWSKGRIEVVAGHGVFCERCIPVKNGIKEAGPVFSHNPPDPRIFPEIQSSSEQPQSEQANRVA